MIIELSKRDFDEYAFKHPYRTFYQTSQYGMLMSKHGFKPIFVGYDEGGLKAAAMILVKEQLNFKVGYCPRGYLVDFNNYKLVEDFTFAPDNFKDSDENSSLEYIERVRGYNHGHHVALNYDGQSTIEFRFFRGTLKFQTFAASLQLVEMMCYAAKHLRKEQLCNVDLKWFKRFAKRKNYAEFNAYLTERGITQ